jgi:hypothetical protein
MRVETTSLLGVMAYSRAFLASRTSEPSLYKPIGKITSAQTSNLQMEIISIYNSRTLKILGFYI